MASAHDSVDAAIREIDRLRGFLKKKSTVQVHSDDERVTARATALAWFNNHSPSVSDALPTEELDVANDAYTELIGYTDRATTRTKYDALLKQLKKELSRLRGLAVLATPATTATPTTDDPPSFAPLVADKTMQLILEERWRECTRCLSAKASLAALVMMGGLLEALLLARLNGESDKSKAFSATSAPKDKKTGKPLPLKGWTLRHYIDVAHELDWISRSAKDVGEVVRDYRNYVHPYKQASHAIKLDDHDAALFWEIAKGIARQLIDKTT